MKDHPTKNTSNQAQKMPARPTCSLLGSPSWYPFRVPTSVYIEIIGQGVGCRAPPPPVFFQPGHISSPSIQNRKIFCSRVSLSTLVIGSSLKISDETASFWRNFDFFAFLGFFGVPGTRVFSGTPIWPKSPKSGLGPRRGRFSQIFRRPKSCAW